MMDVDHAGPSHYNHGPRDAGPSSHWRGRFTGPVTKRNRATLYSRDGIQTLRTFAAAHPSTGSSVCDNVNWIGAGSFCQRELLANVGCALVRRIFSMNSTVRTVFRDYDEYINVAGNTNVTITFYFRDVDGNELQSKAGSGAPGTAGGVLSDWFSAAAPTTYREAGAQLGAQLFYIYASQTLPYHLYKIRITNGVTVSGGDFCLFDIQDWIFKMYSCVSLKLQNITPADDGLVNQDTDITANPLDGVLYRFSGIAPKTATWPGPGTLTTSWATTNLEETSSSNGRIVPNATPTDGFDQPLQKSFFKNCTSAMNIRIEPGDIKFTTVKFKYSGNLQNLLEGVIDRDAYSAAFPAAQGLQNDTIKFGSSMLFALKKSMRTGNVSVKVNYQHDVSCGCVCIPRTKRSTNMEVGITATVPWAV